MKYAFITGSTKGIGKAIGIKLLKEGYFVIFNYANSDIDAEKLENEIKHVYNGKYEFVKSDLSVIENVEAVSDRIRSINHYLDLLVFNTGLTDRSEFGQITYESWNKVFNANVNIPFFLMQSLSKNLNKNANIVFIGSMLGNIPHSVSISYGVSKSAIHALVKNMVKFFSKEGIRINAIAPGFVDTEWQKEKPEWLREKIKGKVALGRFARDEEVADLCYYITTNDYLTGQIIQLDGGYNCE